MEIETALSEYIRTQVLKRPRYELGDNDPLISSGLIDSFHLVDLSLFVEEAFGVRIDDTELNAETFDTLSELADLIRQRRA
ncbi:MAG: acyl carrier protein [Anaerolineales bacterium]|nr:acyl carrier protein [Anaerolineales bacterium]